MDNILSNDLKERIVKQILLEKNLKIIRRQILLNKVLQRELNIVLNSVYNDGNIILYRNIQTGKLMLHNNLDKNSTISIYTISSNQDSNTNQNLQDNQNIIINSNDVGYPIHTIDENRRINLCILYK